MTCIRSAAHILGGGFPLSIVWNPPQTNYSCCETDKIFYYIQLYSIVFHIFMAYLCQFGQSHFASIVDKNCFCHLVAGLLGISRAVSTHSWKFLEITLMRVTDSTKHNLVHESIMAKLSFLSVLPQIRLMYEIWVRITKIAIEPFQFAAMDGNQNLNFNKIDPIDAIKRFYSNFWKAVHTVQTQNST